VSQISVQTGSAELYASPVDVSVTDLRANLSDWLARARNGDVVVVTDRGVPVARLVGIETAGILERLTNEGVIARPVSARRPKATGAKRPRPRRPLAEVVSEQRR
jgi:prevent-host-death family protein